MDKNNETLMNALVDCGAVTPLQRRLMDAISTFCTDAGPELFDLLALVGIADDAAGHGAGNLTDDNLLAVGEAQTHGGAFVEDAGFGIGSYEIIATVELIVFHHAVAGITVDMNIGAVHEDAYHDAFLLDVFFLHGLLDGHHGAVGRRDKSLGVVGNNPSWNAEEHHHHDEED